MSKLVKGLITDTYKKQFENVESAVAINVRGLNANTNNSLRAKLAAKNVKLTVLKNLLAKRAFEETGLGALGEIMQGPTTLAYGATEDVSVVNVARELMGVVKEIPAIEFKGAVMEGTTFGPDEIDRLSKFPTREEALAGVVGSVLGAGGALLGAVGGPGSQIASILSSIEEKLEKGETISKVA